MPLKHLYVDTLGIRPGIYLASICRYLFLDDTIFQGQYDNRTRARLSSLTAWGPLSTCVVAPLTQSTLRVANSESDDGLVLPLRNGKLPSLFCTNEDWKTRCHPRHPFVS